jgi:alpha-tubulin suppressor-like RCC1 family protein
MLWGVDKKGVTNNNKYFGCIFRLNEYLFNVTSGRLWEPHKVCAVATGEEFSVILAQNTENAIINKNKYKVMSWGFRGNDNKPDYKLGRVGYLGKPADSGEMAEVVFDGDDKDTDNYVAKNVRSIKAGSDQALILTDDGNKRELWTWGASTFQKPEKINISELDAPIVSIACGGSKNILITENDTVYEWSKKSNKITKNDMKPKK